MTFQRTFIITSAITCFVLAFLLGFIVTLYLQKEIIHQSLYGYSGILQIHSSLLQITPDNESLRSQDRLSALVGLPNAYHIRAYTPDGKLIWTGPENLTSQTIGTDRDVIRAIRGDKTERILKSSEISNQGINNIPSHSAKIVVPVLSQTHAPAGILVAYMDIGTLYSEINQSRLLIWSITFGIFGLLFLVLVTGTYRISKNMTQQSDNLQKTAQIMESSYMDSLQILATAIESRAPYITGHSQRVALYAVEVGKRLSLLPVEIEKIQYTCMLQNIGLVRIPDSILLKSGKLDAEEITRLRRHPVEGAELLKRSPAFKDVASAVRAHHERMDGTGYPDGLVGDQIPLEARIVAVVDAYIAMITQRPYRLAFTREQAISELKKYAGTQFDLKIVDLVIQVTGEIQERRSGQDRRITDWGPPDGIERRKNNDRRRI